MRNPWLDISLSDYEGHMLLPSVGQAEMLSQLLGSLVDDHDPDAVAVLGCAGGNGFHRIPEDRRIVGIDINPDFITAAAERYAALYPRLELHVLDIDAETLTIEPVSLVFAGLLFEYVRPEVALRFAKSICRDGGVLAAVLQLPLEGGSVVSPSPFRSLEVLAPAIHLLPPEALEAAAQAEGFHLEISRTVELASGKSFALRVFRRG
ncbi:MAG: class I SAM-dependent methyltransferase [Candidatus Eisenbacteria bacterium]